MVAFFRPIEIFLSGLISRNLRYHLASPSNTKRRVPICPSVIKASSLERDALTNRAATGLRPREQVAASLTLVSVPLHTGHPLLSHRRSTALAASAYHPPPQPWPSPRAPATRFYPASSTRSPPPPPPPPRPLSRQPQAWVATGSSRRLTRQRRGRRCGRTRQATRRAKLRCTRRRSTRRARPAASLAAVSHT